MYIMEGPDHSVSISADVLAKSGGWGKISADLDGENCRVTSVEGYEGNPVDLVLPPLAATTLGLKLMRIAEAGEGKIKARHRNGDEKLDIMALGVGLDGRVESVQIEDTHFSVSDGKIRIYPVCHTNSHAWRQLALSWDLVAAHFPNVLQMEIIHAIMEKPLDDLTQLDKEFVLQFGHPSALWKDPRHQNAPSVDCEGGDCGCDASADESAPPPRNDGIDGCGSVKRWKAVARYRTERTLSGECAVTWFVEELSEISGLMERCFPWTALIDLRITYELHDEAGPLPLEVDLN